MKVNTIKQDFPILKKTIHGHPLAYLDNASTTQKPNVVINALNHYYCETNANVHRGVYELSEQATKAYEDARQIVQNFIHAKHAKECIFVKSTTEGINLVASSYGEKFVEKNDEILITAMEHHSNIVPWQMLCQKKGAHLKVVDMNALGELDLNSLEQKLNKKTKLLAITHASNALGTLNPLKKIIELAHSHHIPVLIDAAQSITHVPIDVQELNCDFLVFSGHKCYGPTGIGVLYGKSKWLESMPPYQGGGDMILRVTFEKTTYNDIPYKFEAGTPPIAEVIGLGEALKYIKEIGWENIIPHEKYLLDYATKALLSIPNIQLIGTAKEKIGVISFTLQGIHPHDIGSITNQYGVAIRTGNHCAMPVMDFFQVPATTRASFGIYNTKEDIDQLINALLKVKHLFKI